MNDSLYPLSQGLPGRIIRVCIDDCDFFGSDYEEKDRHLDRTIDISVRGLKGISELFQLCGPSGENDVEVDRSSLADIGFLIDELSENINMCLELKKISARQQLEAKVEGGAQ